MGYSPTLGRWLERDPEGYIDGMSPYQFVRSNPLIYTDAFGLWSKENVEAILCKSAMGKTTIERLQKATVLKSEYVRSYKRTRAKETDPFGEWQAHDWGGMTTTAKDGGKTIHVPDSFTDEEAARLLVHEGSHTAGGGELEAYTDETTWAIESEVKSRQGFTKKDKDGKIVPDAEAIKGYVDKNYKGWYTPDPNVQWKKDKDGLRVEYGKEEEQKDWKCPC